MRARIEGPGQHGPHRFFLRALSQGDVENVLRLDDRGRSEADKVLSTLADISLYSEGAVSYSDAKAMSGRELKLVISRITAYHKAKSPKKGT